MILSQSSTGTGRRRQGRFSCHPLRVRARAVSRAARWLVTPFWAMVLSACATVVASAGSGLAGNLTVAMMNQDDPAIVRDGAPAYLLMLDSFVEGAPENESVLSAAAELYAAYGVVFVDEPLRARRLTRRARSYGQRALCSSNADLCGIWDLAYDDFLDRLGRVRERDVAVLYTFALSWIAYIQAHSDNFGALARLPQVEAALRRVQEVDPAHEAASVERFLGILNTIRPPALGGDFEAGQAHFERAIELSGGRDLGIQVDYARYYARTLYERELHDRLLQDVVAADPVARGLTLFNTLAQDEARELLDSADAYF
ncbi:TRAP transporter TatT component family protein [Elongatibacter sediminis]|uniref:TRAP transporter TatT component family protein n=1 Tax=Elongatibacter sediminis TaxID=3119006 RepID=A0AAW9RCU0_9GAMM